MPQQRRAAVARHSSIAFHANLPAKQSSFLFTLRQWQIAKTQQLLRIEVALDRMALLLGAGHRCAGRTRQPAGGLHHLVERCALLTLQKRDALIDFDLALGCCCWAAWSWVVLLIADGTAPPATTQCSARILRRAAAHLHGGDPLTAPMLALVAKSNGK